MAVFTVMDRGKILLPAAEDVINTLKYADTTAEGIRNSDRAEKKC